MHVQQTKNNKNNGSKLLAITICFPKNPVQSFVDDRWTLFFLVVVAGDTDNTRNNKAEMLWASTEKLYALKLSFLVIVS